MLHAKELAMGSAFLDVAATRAQLMEGKVHQQLFEVSVDSIEKCQTCSVRYLCGGGCRARAYADGHGLLGDDPYATISCSYYAKIVSLLERRFGKER
jgi:radical SAM protein with 4Fe4S-binding SPASM domain